MTAALMCSLPTEAAVERSALTLVHSFFFFPFFLWWIGTIALIARPSRAHDPSRGRTNAAFIYSRCQSGSRLIAAIGCLSGTFQQGLLKKNQLKKTLVLNLVIHQ